MLARSERVARRLGGAPRRTHATALLSDEWRSALIAGMQKSGPAQDSVLPFRLERKVMKADQETQIGTLVLSAANELSNDRPGNGGMRLWNYRSHDAAQVEAHGLAVGMEVKHKTFNTGFAGAKLVCASETPVSQWKPDDKAVLIETAAAMLTELDGAMYTGCDMNTTTDDMDTLAAKCPYVLAAVGNPACCPNTATAFGVLGAVEATLGGSVAGKTLLVHGCGNVGKVVAEELIANGAAKVYTVDESSERAQVAGCTPLAADSAWWTTKVDAIVPCSSSGLLTTEVAQSLQCGAIVGATNLPFATAEAKAIAENECGVTFVPEGVSSAGAVVVDSIEFYAHDSFTSAPPQDLYQFTRELISDKVQELISTSNQLRVPASLVVPLVAERSTTPIGGRFPEWHARAKAKALLDVEERAKAAEALLRANQEAKERQMGANGGTNASFSMSRVFHAAALSRCSQPFGRMQTAGFASSTGAAKAAGVARGLATSSSIRTLCTRTPSETAADVIIAGGGVMGLNIAYQLRRRDPNLSVLVLERAPALGFGSSGYSTGFQRAYYSFDETMQFALDGMEAYKNWTDYLQDSEANAKFTETGALWMLGYDNAQNDAMVARLAKFGVDADRIDQAELAKRFPLINPEPFPMYNDEGDEVEQNLGPFSAVYEHGCGHIDSSTCLEDLARAARRDGAQIRMNSRIESFVTDRSSGRCTGVKMVDGTVIEAGVAVVNASGPWFNKLNATVGLSLSTEALPTRIQVGHKWIPDEYCSLPFVADGFGPSGIYFMRRAANNQLVFGSVAHRFESEIVDPDDYNTALDPEVKQDYLNCLFHRLPGLPREGEIVGFSSMYTVNQDDVHPMIGETKVKGLWACNGFSGHGFKLAPAVGSLVSQQITGQVTDRWETTVPHDFMGPYREPLSLKVKTHFA